LGEISLIGALEGIPPEKLLDMHGGEVAPAGCKAVCAAIFCIAVAEDWASWVWDLVPVIHSMDEL
jgi:hypothetical protein